MLSFEPLIETELYFLTTHSTGAESAWMSFEGIVGCSQGLLAG
jgi:hypothetical protein